jgi:cytochrome c-type biogenesis protein CcmH/NrfG
MEWMLGIFALVAAAGAIASWRAGRDRRVAAGLGVAAALLAISGVWRATEGTPTGAGSPESMLADSARAFNAMPGVDGAAPAPGTAGSLPELAERLAARLEASPDDAQGWSLLAATYRQLGREEEAARAEQRAIDAGGDPAAFADQHKAMMHSSRSGGSLLAAVTGGSPASARYVAEGQRLRIERRFAEAAEAFRKAVEADPTDADSWADLADCQSVAAGRDLSVGREAIEKALSLDPQHRKALWLRASLELQEKRFADAAATWRTLAGLVPPDSPDARVIAANIAEADELASNQGKAG